LVNIELIIVTAIITTIGLILITVSFGKKAGRSTNRILGIIGFVPLGIVAIKLIIAITIDHDTEAGGKAIDTVIEMLPETVISALIGYVAGVFLWGIYRKIKRIF
jgi:hypothetical protein